MATVVHLGESEDRSAKQKAFRKQFADNLNAALDRGGAIPSGYGRVVGVAELFVVSQNTAANWLKGEGVPELSRMTEIASILGTMVEQLVAGDQSAGSHVIDESYVMIDMHEEDSLDRRSWYTLPETLRSIGLSNEVRMLQIGNDDMAPFVSRGDVVIYDPRVNRIVASGVFVIKVNDRYIVRRVQRGIKQAIRLICDNPVFEDEQVEASDFSENEASGQGLFVAGQVVGRLLVGGC